MVAALGSRGFLRIFEPPFALLRGESDSIVMPSRLTVCAALALAASACTNKAGEPACPDRHYLVAVAADANASGPIYVADDQAGNTGYWYVTADDGSSPGYSYVIEHADNREPVFRGTNDGSALALLTPSSGGVIVVNGGAAARRIDASGKLLWTVGYGTVTGVFADLTTADVLFVADAEGVRAFALDGSELWKHEWPGQVSTVLRVVSDRAGGAWVLGTDASFGQSPSDGSSGDTPSAGPFVAHLDGNGAWLGAHAWADTDYPYANQIIMTVDENGTPLLLAMSAPDGGSSEFTAFDASAMPLWRTLAPTQGLLLASDAAGNPFVITYGGITYHDGRLEIARLGSMGSVGAATTVARAPSPSALDLATAAGRNGILVVGQWSSGDVSCPTSHFLSLVNTADLEVTPLALGVP
jgi:hypothetical protein